MTTKLSHVATPQRADARVHLVPRFRPVLSASQRPQSLIFSPQSLSQLPAAPLHNDELSRHRPWRLSSATKSP
jgi:hypothetical protein